MASCPKCHTPGAYIGFNSVECRNPDCEDFVLFELDECPCCGKPPSECTGPAKQPPNESDPDKAPDAGGGPPGNFSV